MKERGQRGKGTSLYRHLNEVLKCKRFNIQKGNKRGPLRRKFEACLIVSLDGFAGYKLADHTVMNCVHSFLFPCP